MHSSFQHGVIAFRVFQIPRFRDKPQGSFWGGMPFLQFCRTLSLAFELVAQQTHNQSLGPTGSSERTCWCDRLLIEGMNLGIPLKETIGDGLSGSFPHSLLSSSKTNMNPVEMGYIASFERGFEPPANPILCAARRYSS